MVLELGTAGLRVMKRRRLDVGIFSVAFGRMTITYVTTRDFELFGISEV